VLAVVESGVVSLGSDTESSPECSVLSLCGQRQRRLTCKGCNELSLGRGDQVDKDEEALGWRCGAMKLRATSMRAMRLRAMRSSMMRLGKCVGGRSRVRRAGGKYLLHGDECSLQV
jgi:hypothetical protein